MNAKPIYVQGYLRGNLGDDLFLKVLTERYPNEHFVVRTLKQFASKYSELNNVKIQSENLLHRVIDKIVRVGHLEKLISLKYKAFVEIGGSIFQQIDPEEGVWAIRQMWKNSGIPYFTIGCNFGPILSESYLHAHRVFFDQTSGVVFRDHFSLGLFSDLSSVDEAPDVVFNLKIKDTTKRKSIVISPIDLMYVNRVGVDILKKFAPTYEEKIRRWIHFFVAKGYNVDLVSFCEFEGDTEAIKRILSGLHKTDKEHTKFEEGEGIESILGKFEKAEYVIGSRYHSMILGWLVKSKLLVVPYSRKTTDVISDIFPSQKQQSIAEFSNESELLTTDDFSEISKTVLEKSIEKSRAQFEFLDEFLKKRFAKS